jgi:hypothetical protein
MHEDRRDPTPEQFQQMTMRTTSIVYGIRPADGRRLQSYRTPGHAERNTLHLSN